MPDYRLEVNDLKQHFKIKGRRNTFVKAVDGVSFAIEQGKTLGLVGESGCGKSTVARSVIRIYEPTAGDILVDGENIARKRFSELKPYRRRIQMIFQDPYSSLNPRMTVRDIIAEPIIASGVGTSNLSQMVEEILAKVGLNKNHASRYPHEFSGGQRQRIGIARALIVKPDIVLCDEPISALDVSIQAQVVNMLSDFQQELGLSYLFIAHDLSMVRYVSHDVGVMYLGRIVEKCESEEIYKQPLHPYTQALLSAIPMPDPREAKNKSQISIEGEVPSPINPPNGCHFHKRCKHAKPVCSESAPELKEVGSCHFVACHLY